MRTVWIASKYFLLQEFSVSTCTAVRYLSPVGVSRLREKRNLEKFLDILNSEALVYLRMCFKSVVFK